MNIAVDATILGFDNPTGVSVAFAQVLDKLLNDPRDRYTLNYFSWRSRSPVRAKLELDWKERCVLRRCSWLPYRIYKVLERTIRFPWRWLFGSDAEVSLFFYHNLPTGVAGKKVVVIHDMVYMACPETMADATRRMHDRALIKTCDQADMIVTVSQFSKSEIITYLGIDEKKIRIMYNGVDATRFSPSVGKVEIESLRNRLDLLSPYFLYVGTLEPRKNLVRLIAAYQALRETRAGDVPDLVIAGGVGWCYDEIFAQVQRSGLGDHVRFTGYVDDADLPALMKGCFAFVFPSLYEGFGLPPLEAMACGVPVLTSDTAALPEVVGEDAVLVDPESVESITDGLLRLLTDAELRQSLAERGPARARNFSWQAAADTMRDVFAEVLAS